ncbi:DUF4142 domain-containing protein [Methylocapsa polymorpha]|uniref:DUF4142 domain-containing protein n=1 Tax=Methylocapsa polymorpha TaxID=3080828 RepID=A0ABZ0HQH1_9HYPH|nr:DUF4142 domain-containing protein [Methylocapsa sp. RX1]
MRGIFMSASLFAIAALIAAPANAQTAGQANAPTDAAQASPAGQEPVAHFLASAIPNANFLAQTSRMAIGRSKNGKIRDFAQQIAKTQTAAANSLTAWVNTSGPVVTSRSTFSGSTARVSAPRLLQSQADLLQRLSILQGRDFDALYISSQKDALQQLANSYQGYIDNGGDPGLHAIAVRELENLMTALTRLDAL